MIDTSTPAARRGLRGRIIIIAACLLAAVGSGVAFTQYSALKGDDPPAPPKPATAETEPTEKTPDEPEVVRLTAAQMRKFGVRLETVRKRHLNSDITAVGRVAQRAEATAIVGSPAPGRVVDIKVGLGDPVKAGDPLLTIESPELGEAQSELLQRKRAAAVAESTLAPLTEILARVKKLHEQDKLIGVTEVQERELELKKAEGALELARVAVKAAENRLRLFGMTDQAVDELARTGSIQPRYVVRATQNGEIIERQVNLGELVKPDRDKLLTLADTTQLCVWANVPEARASETRLGMPAEVLGAATEHPIAARVSYVAAALDNELHALRLRIDLPNGAGLRSGMAVQVRLKLPGDGAATVCVPTAAIFTLGNKSVVFVPDGDSPGAFRSRPVTTGPSHDGQTCIASGLAEGDRVVSSGGEVLRADILKASAKDED